jgi:hypothetical protein
MNMAIIDSEKMIMLQEYYNQLPNIGTIKLGLDKRNSIANALFWGVCSPLAITVQSVSTYL